MCTRHERGRCWKLKEEALDRPLWGTGFGTGYGTVVRRTSELIKLLIINGLINVPHGNINCRLNNKSRVQMQ